MSTSHVTPVHTDAWQARIRQYALPVVILIGVVLIATAVGVEFRHMHEMDPIVTGPGVTRISNLSEYLDSLQGSPGDTPIYFFEGSEPGGTILVLGGTHPNEIAGRLATVILVENMQVGRGRVIVIPLANASGATHSAPSQGVPQYVTIETDWGSRRFRYGDRLTNPLHQYPDPEVHIHYPSGSSGSGAEARNLNRNFPGRPDGTLTERVAYAITQLILTENVDLVLDMHEARPMNPIVNALVVHDHAMDIGALSVMELEAFEGIRLRLEPSPREFRGLTHRELGDSTTALSTLVETPNVAMDWLRGPTDEELVLTGRDEFMAKAITRPGLVYVDYNHEVGLPIEERVGTHLSTFLQLIGTFSEFHPHRPISVTGVPRHGDVVTNGVGHYLKEI